MSNIDALPYFDKQVENPAAKAAAQALVEAELKSTPKPASDDPRIPAEAEIFSKSSQLAELLANYANNPIKAIDPSKYAPPSFTEDDDLERLKEIEARGRIGEGHMALRVENTNVISSYGPNAWLIRNYQLNSQVTELEQALTELKEKVTDVNRSRRVYQEETGQHLTRLEGRWQDLIGSTVQLEMACMAMEGEVGGLRRKEEDLRREVKELEAVENL